LRPDAAPGSGSLVEAGGGCELRLTGGAGIGSGRVDGLGGRRWHRRAAVVGHGWPRPACIGHDWPRLATVSRGGRRLPRSLLVAASVALSWWRRQRAGWHVLVVLWWCFQLCQVSSSGGVAEMSGCSWLLWSRACGGHGAKSGESLHWHVLVGMMAALLGVAPLAGGIMARHHVLSCAGLSGEDLVLLWTYDDGALTSCPPWRRHSWSLVQVEVRLALQVAHLVRVAVVVQMVHGCLRSWDVAQGLWWSRWRLGGGDALFAASDICVLGRGEWGGGRGKAPTQSGQDQWFSLVLRWSVLLLFLWIRGLESDGPVAEELVLLSHVVGVVLCCVVCPCSGVVFVWWCPLWRVMYQLLLILKWYSSAPAFMKKELM
jgi:hypothetical protein